MGLSLEETAEGLKKLESNSIEAYLDENLLEFINQNGKITIDFRPHQFGGGSYLITVGEDTCSPGNCGSGC